MQSANPPSSSSPAAPPSTGRRIRVRSIKRPSFDQEATRLPSAPSDDSEWVSPFTLPPLPALKRNRAQSGLNRSPEERVHDRQGSSAYYAAAWGSPYATPSPNSSPAPRDTRNRSVDFESSSPLVARKTGLNRVESLSARARNFAVPSTDSAGPSTGHISASSVEPEHRRNWLSESDGSDNEAQSALGKTPTKLARTLGKIAEGSSSERISAQNHQLQTSVDTITPETFDGSSSSYLKGKTRLKSRPSMDAEDADLLPAGQDTENPEKPLPGIPKGSDDHESNIAQSRPGMPATVQSFQRPKKKVPWNGKSCIIALPLSDRESAGLPPPLTLQEIQERLRKWMNQGYPIHGFSIGDWSSPHEHSGGASRPTFPDPAELYAENQKAPARVRIPNQAEWDAWVEHLKEEKLRALGVTPSNSDAPLSIQSPLSSAISRVSSTYPSMTASPPLPPTSATSNQERGGKSPFSPFIPGLPGNSFGLGGQSATPPPGIPLSGHGYRQSIAIPNLQQRMNSPFDFPGGQQTGFRAGMRSPLDQLGRRQFSPGHTQNLQSMGQMLSPQGFQDVRNMYGNSQVEHIRRQQEFIARQQQQVHAQMAAHHRQASMFPLYSNSNDHLPKTPVIESPRGQSPEIMHPTPRSHRHNLSAALEKGMHVSNGTSNVNESRSEGMETEQEAMIKEARDEDGSAADEAVQEELPILARPETLREADEKSEIETNPSIAGTPLLLDGKDPFTKLQGSKKEPEQHKAEELIQASQSSAPKLNVEAKEFNPSGAFSSSNFVFGANTFAPTFGSKVQPFGFTAHKPKAPSLSKLNVTAPEFTPSFLKESTTSLSAFDESTLKSAVDTTPEKSVFDPRSSTFSFSSVSFNVEAPEFKPSSEWGTSLDLSSEKSADLKNSIFGEVFIDPSSKVMRRTTKALPIVRPKSKEGEESDVEADLKSESEPDDETGRPSAPSDRQKRARRIDVDGDQLPLFADSAPFKSFADTEEQSQSNEPKIDVADANKADMPSDDEQRDEQEPKAVRSSIDKSNTELQLPLETDAATLQPQDSIEPEKHTAESFTSLEADKPTLNFQPTPEKLEEVETFLPTDMSDPPADKQEEEIEDDAAERTLESTVDDDQSKPTLSAEAAAFVPPRMSVQQKESTMSATAEPFIFKPSVKEFMPQSRGSAEPKQQNSKGLMASRFAPESSPELASPSQDLSPSQIVQKSSPATNTPQPQGLMASRYAQASTPEQSHSPPQTGGWHPVVPQELYMRTQEDDGELLEIPVKVESSEAHISASDMSAAESRLGEPSASHEPYLREKHRENQSASPSLASGPDDISLEQINAAMKEMEDNPDLGVIREDSPIQSTPLIDMRLPPNFRSDAPSPSPRRLGRIIEQQPPTPFGGLNFASGIHQLAYGSGDVSDWNNDLSPQQQKKLEARANFFDDHVNDLVDSVVENRLAPLERALQEIHQSVTSIPADLRNTRRQSRSTGNKDSDADDEDDQVDYQNYRARSPQRRERKHEQIKVAVAEALAAYKASESISDAETIRSVLDEIRQTIQKQPSQAPTQVDISELHTMLTEMKQLAQRELPQPTLDMTEIRTALMEMRELAQKEIPPQQVDLSDFHQAVQEMRELSQNAPPTAHADLNVFQETLREMQQSVQAMGRIDKQADLKTAFEDIVAKHTRIRDETIDQRKNIEEELRHEMRELESRRTASEKRADDEAALRREAEDELAIITGRLKESEERVIVEKEASEAAKRSLETFVNEQQGDRQVTIELEELRLENVALKSTLDEYRKSSDQWREDIREERAKTRDFARALQEVREQYDDRLESRQVLRAQIDRLQVRISEVMQDVHHDEAEWRRKEHDLLSKNQLLQTALDHETNRRARVELDADNMSKEHKEGLQFKVRFEHAQQEITRLSDVIANLQADSRKHQDAAYHAQRELVYAKNNGDVDSVNATVRLQAELDAASSALQNLRADSETQISRLRSRLETAEADLDEQKLKHNKSIAHMTDAHNRVVEEIDQKHVTELQKVQHAHEQKLNELRDDQMRQEEKMTEDKHRLAQQLAQKLSLSEDKVKHLEGKIADLDDRLDITKSAARAAVEAATAKGINLPTPAPSVVASPPHRPSITSASMPLAKGTDLPEKISPQALRESILVLQDQLQNREQRIEKLEAEIAAFDKEAPTKVKERDTEITMLRELLEVRLEDLQDLISALDKPEYDQTAVKDAAIRLKTQMKMEQQLKERVISGTGLNNLPASITSGLVNLTQSPRAIVASAAWGNWRKVRDTGVSAVTDFASSLNSQTPSRAASNASTLLSSIMTQPMTNLKSPTEESANPVPPLSSNMRPLAAAAAARRATAAAGVSGVVDGARPLRAYSSQPRTLSGLRRTSVSRQTRPGSSGSIAKLEEPSSTRVQPPSTPLHLNTESDFGDDIDEDASPLDGKNRSFGLDNISASPTTDETDHGSEDEDVVEVIEEE